VAPLTVLVGLPTADIIGFIIAADAAAAARGMACNTTATSSTMLVCN